MSFTEFGETPSKSEKKNPPEKQKPKAIFIAYVLYLFTVAHIQISFDKCVLTVHRVSALFYASFGRDEK